MLTSETMLYHPKHFTNYVSWKGWPAVNKEILSAFKQLFLGKMVIRFFVIAGNIMLYG